LQNVGGFLAGNYFPTDKSVDRVHISVDRSGVLDPPWTDAGADRWHGGTLTGAWPPAAPVHGSSPAGAQKRQGNMGNPVGGSPRRGQQCGDRATGQN
jgi:hypothetical protein